ncbi:unnamed protein product [Closterium sp. NIES-54]
MDPETAALHPSAIPAIAPGCVRMSVGGGFAGQALGGGRSYFRGAYTLDMKFDLMPPWLINFVARQLAGSGYHQRPLHAFLSLPHPLPVSAPSSPLLSSPNSGACTLDMKFDLMPPWLINFVARQLAGAGYHLLCHEVDTIIKATAAAAASEKCDKKCDKKKGRGAFQQLLASDPVYVGLRKAMEEYGRGKAEEEERRRREGSEEEGRSLRELGEKVEEEVERLVSSLSKRESVLGPEEAEKALLQLEAAAASAVALTRPSVEPLGSQAKDRSGSRYGNGLAASEASAAAATIIAAATAVTAATAAANAAEGPPSASTSFSSVTQSFSSGPLPSARLGGLEAGEGMASLLRESSSVRSGPLPSVRTVTGSTSSGSYGIINNLRVGEIPDMLNSSYSVTSSRSSFGCGDSASASGSSSQSSSGSSSPSSYPGLSHRDPAIFRAVATLDKAILFVRARAAAAAAAAAAAEEGSSDSQGIVKHEKHVTSVAAATGTKSEAFSCSPSQPDGFQEEVVLGDGETGNNALMGSSVGPVKSAARPVTVAGESGRSGKDAALGCLENARDARKANSTKESQPMALAEGIDLLDQALEEPTWKDLDKVTALISKQLDVKNGSAAAAVAGGSSNSVADYWAAETVKLLEDLKSVSVEALATTDPGDRNAWKMCEEGPEHRAMLRKGPEGTAINALCMEGRIDSPVHAAVAMTRDAGFFKEWWPQGDMPVYRIVENRYLARVGDGFDITYMKFKVPWPFPWQEFAMIFFTIYDADTGVATTVVRTVSVPPALSSLPPLLPPHPLHFSINNFPLYLSLRVACTPHSPCSAPHSLPLSPTPRSPLPTPISRPPPSF